MNWIYTYLAVAGTILASDAIWLGLVARKFYASQLGSLMRKPVKALPALSFYCLYAAGLVVLAVRPGDAETGIASSVWLGAVVGFTAYGTYNMTNYATLKDWPARMSAVDWTWGTGLSALAAFAGACINAQLG